MSEDQTDPYSERRWKTGTSIAIGLFLLQVGLNAAFLYLTHSIPGWLAAIDSLTILTGVAAWTFGADALSTAKGVVSEGVKAQYPNEE